MRTRICAGTKSWQPCRIVCKAIQQIAEAEKFDLILQEAVYISARIDITDRVLKALADK